MFTQLQGSLDDAFRILKRAIETVLPLLLQLFNVAVVIRIEFGLDHERKA